MNPGLLTIQLDYKLVNPLLNWSELESGSIRWRVRLISGSISQRGQKAGRAARALDGLEVNGLRAGARVKLPHTVSMEPFLQYITVHAKTINEVLYQSFPPVSHLAC